jgi:hypothetical protein
LAARLWSPLRDPVDAVDEREGCPLSRFRRLVDACRLDPAERALVVDAVIETHDWCYDIVDSGARKGLVGYAGYWTAAMQRRADRGRRWLEENEGALRDALA